MSAILERDRRHVWHPYTQHQTAPDPVVITRASGASLYDADGREILDMIASWWTCTHGHAHPKLNAALAVQAARFQHVMFAGFTHQPAVDLATVLAALLPGDLNRVFYSDNGSTAVEVALKMAIQASAARGQKGKRALLAFEGGYHGDTLGAMSVGRGSGYFRGFDDLMIEVDLIPFPATHENDEEAERKEADALAALRARLAQDKNRYAALIVEPMLQGSSGMRMCRPGFLRQLVATAQEEDVLVIFDEVATGFGRTGMLFAMERANIAPDIVCLSKGLTAGYMPLAATVASEALFSRFLGDDFEKALPHGHSFTANPLACAVALKSLELFREEKTMERIARIEHRHRAALRLFRSQPEIENLRVMGSVLAFDMKSGGLYQSADSVALRDWFLSKGLNIRPIGRTVYLMPPYCVTDRQLERAYAKMIQGVDRFSYQPASVA
jgi:adenosylmethionine-8-amino-7-oxononanoate aminotransferase